MIQLTRPLRAIAIAGALLACAAPTFAQADSPIGMWQTIDDNTHQPKALVQIAEDGMAQNRSPIFCSIANSAVLFNM